MKLSVFFLIFVENLLIMIFGYVMLVMFATGERSTAPFRRTVSALQYALSMIRHSYREESPADKPEFHLQGERIVSYAAAESRTENSGWQ